MTPEQWAGSKGTPQLRNAMQASITSLVTGAAYEPLGTQHAHRESHPEPCYARFYKSEAKRS